MCQLFFFLFLYNIPLLHFLSCIYKKCFCYGTKSIKGLVLSNQIGVMRKQGLSIQTEKNVRILRLAPRTAVAYPTLRNLSNKYLKATGVMTCLGLD